MFNPKKIPSVASSLGCRSRNPFLYQKSSGSPFEFGCGGCGDVPFEAPPSATPPPPPRSKSPPPPHAACKAASLRSLAKASALTSTARRTRAGTRPRLRFLLLLLKQQGEEGEEEVVEVDEGEGREVLPPENCRVMLLALVGGGKNEEIRN